MGNENQNNQNNQGGQQGGQQKPGQQNPGQQNQQPGRQGGQQGGGQGGQQGRPGWTAESALAHSHLAIEGPPASAGGLFLRRCVVISLSAR